MKSRAKWKIKIRDVWHRFESGFHFSPTNSEIPFAFSHLSEQLSFVYFSRPKIKKISLFYGFKNNHKFKSFGTINFHVSDLESREQLVI